MAEEPLRRGTGPSSPKANPNRDSQRSSLYAGAREPRAPQLVTGSRPAPAYPLASSNRSSVHYVNGSAGVTGPQYPAAPSSRSSSSSASVISGTAPQHERPLSGYYPPSQASAAPLRHGPQPSGAPHQYQVHHPLQHQQHQQQPNGPSPSAAQAHLAPTARPVAAQPPQYPFQVALSETSRALERRIMQPPRLALTDGSPVPHSASPADTHYVERQSPPRKPENRSRELVPASVHQDLVHTNLYLQPELDKERRLRISEQMRADRAERLFKDQLEKGVKHLERLSALQQSYDELERCAQAKARMEETMRRSLEMQLLQLLDARSKATAASSTSSEEATFLRKRVADLEARLASGSGCSTPIPTPPSASASVAGGNGPAQLEELEARGRQLEAALQQARSELTGVRAELGPLRTRCDAMEKRLAETQEQLLAAHDKHSAELLAVDREYQARIGGHVADNESLAAKLAAVQSELQALRATHAALQDKLTASDRQLHELRKHKDSSDGFEVQQRALQSEIAMRDVELNAARRASVTAAEQLESAHRTVAAHEATIAGLRAQEAKHKATEDLLREAKQALQQCESDLAATKARLAESEELARTSYDRLADTEGRLALSAIQLKEHAIKLELASADRDAQRANCDRLQDSLSSSQELVAALKREIETLQSSRGDETRGMSAELAALRTALQARTEDYQTSTRELQEAKQSLFIAQSDLNNSRLQASEHAARVAALTKQVDDHHTAAADQRALIASQQQQIAETHAALHQAKQQAQTELAALQNKWQSLQAACSAREAELSQVRQQLDAADAERTAMRAKQVEAAATVATLRAELAALKADAARTEQELADRNAALAEHQQRVREAAAAAVTAKTQLDGERQSTQRHIGELQAQIVELQTSLSHTRALVSSKDQEIASLRSGNSEISDRHSMHLAKRDEEALSLRLELDAAQRALAQQQAAAGQREQHIKSLEQAQAELLALQKQHEALTHAHDQLTQSSEAQQRTLSQRLAELTAQLASNEKARQELERQTDAMQQQSQRAEADARVAIASKTAEIDVLRRQQSEHAAVDKALADTRLRCELLEREQAAAKDKHERESSSLKDSIARAQSQAEESAAQAAALRKALQEREALLAKQQQASTEEIETLRQQLDKLRASERQLEQQQIALTQQHEAAAREAAALLERVRAEHEQRCSRLEATISQQKDELRVAQQHVATLKADLAVAAERADALTRRLSDAESDARTRIAALQEQLRQLQARLEAANAKAEQAGAESARSKQEASMERERAAQAMQQQQTLNGELKRRLQESEESAGKLREEHQAALRRCQRADESAAAAKADAQHRLDRQEQLAEEHRAALQAVEGERDRLSEDVGRQRQALVELERKATEMVQTITGQRAQLATAERAIAEKSAAIATMEQTLMELEEKLIHEKTETYLVKLSEKDARIAALEMVDKKKHAAEITELQQARAVDLAALREQFNKRSELMAGRMNTTRESLNQSRELSTRDDLLDRLQLLLDDHERLRNYIDQLVAEVLKQPEQTSMAILNGLPRMQHDAPAVTIDEAEELPEDTIRQHIRTMDAGNKKLEVYVNQLLGRIVEHKPAILELMNMG